MIQQSYGEYTIIYNEDKNKWVASLGKDAVSESESLKGVKANLDRRDKEVEKFNRFEAFFSCYGSGYQKVIVTSIGAAKYGDYEAWITLPDKTRQKVSLHNLCEITPENQAKIERISVISNEVKQLNNELAELRNNLARVKYGESGKDYEF